MSSWNCTVFRARRAALVALGAALMGTALPGCAASERDAVPLDEARAALGNGSAVVFDIREPDEHARGVAAGARLLPMSQLPARLAEIPTDRPVLLMCNTQNRSSATLRRLRDGGGYGNVRYVQGGMSEWVRRGWPTVAPGGR